MLRPKLTLGLPRRIVQRERWVFLTFRNCVPCQLTSPDKRDPSEMDRCRRCS